METQTIESLDEHLVNFTRFVLALSGLIIIYIDPSEPDRFVNITYTALALYTVYSAFVYFLSRKNQAALQGIPLYWIDVAWYLLLISLSSGTNSLFFFFFYFAILVASFRSGYRAGLDVTIVSVTLFIAIGYFTTPTPIEPNRFLLRPICLASIGYLMASWGGSETTHKRRLALLKDVSKSSNPRFGVDQTINSIMQKLREFYDADTCLVINTRAASDTYILRRVDRRSVELTNRVESVGTEAAQLVAWPAEWAVTWHSSAKRWLRKSACSVYNFSSGERVKDVDCERYAFVADLIASDSFITIPIYQRYTFAGRLYLTSKARYFNYSDVDFLRQVMDHVMPMIDSTQLVDRLASQAADYERQRLSRDIHDSAIQPYIGLKLGLDALRRQVSDSDAVAKGLAELGDRTDSVIKDLRAFVGGLKDPAGSNERVNVLASAVERHAEQLGELYGIRVDVRIAENVNVNDRLAAELFQIVREGLSNIRRHTASPEARISMTSLNGDIVLDIENSSGGDEVRNNFTPRSLTERATALGGRVSVNVNDSERTIVSVVIPM
jgi:signal transduction histidine kinase